MERLPWSEIEKRMPDRKPSSLKHAWQSAPDRSRCLSYFYSDEEDETICCSRAFDSPWAETVEQMPGLTYWGVTSRYYGLVVADSEKVAPKACVDFHFALSFTKSEAERQSQIESDRRCRRR